MSVVRFLDGRRLFLIPPDLSLEVRALETRMECFMMRLSFFVDVKVDEGVGKDTAVRLNADLGLTGACLTLAIVWDCGRRQFVTHHFAVYQQDTVCVQERNAKEK
jgi:hypothetical protein